MKQLSREAMDLMIEQQLIIQAAAEKGIEFTYEDVDSELARIKEPFYDDDEFRRRLYSDSYTEDSYREQLRDMIAAKLYLYVIRMEAMNVSDDELEHYYRDN